MIQKHLILLGCLASLGASSASSAATGDGVELSKIRYFTGYMKVVETTQVPVTIAIGKADTNGLAEGVLRGTKAVATPVTVSGAIDQPVNRLFISSSAAIAFAQDNWCKETHSFEIVPSDDSGARVPGYRLAEPLRMTIRPIWIGLFLQKADGTGSTEWARCASAPGDDNP